MSTNLRLSAESAAALRAEADRTGRSQQDLLREAVARFLGLAADARTRDRAVASGLVIAPTAFRDVTPTIELSRGVTALDLLGRDDR